jgi:VIT1/CCC1 family predicted Fe2+/Mn2+ transporter
VLFAAGAIVPVLPFLFLAGVPAMATSIGLSAVALAAIGVVSSLFSGRSVLFSATRQVVVGCAAAAVTYGVGALLGVSLS